MFEALTARRRFSVTRPDGYDETSIRAPANAERGEPRINFGSQLERVVAKLLEKDPKQRYQNLVDVATDLQYMKKLPNNIAGAAETAAFSRNQQDEIAHDFHFIWARR